MKTNTADGKNLLDLILVNDNEQIIIYIHLGKYDSISVADPWFDLMGGAGVDFFGAPGAPPPPGFASVYCSNVYKRLLKKSVLNKDVLRRVCHLYCFRYILSTLQKAKRLWPTLNCCPWYCVILLTLPSSDNMLL